MHLVFETVAPAYTKDYDSDLGERATEWPKRWNISNWGVLAAYDNDQRVGGAVLAFDTEDLWFLEWRKDVAALLDIRVSLGSRRGGIGKGLFHAAVDWARKRNCDLLKIETQNVNVGACRFYAAMGCELGAVNRFAYLGSCGASHPDEVQLVWYLGLD
jgi:GNAT superfamily N-acetyltransferase